MIARDLLALFDWIYLTAMCAWVGSILFFTFGMAPVLSRVLGTDTAAKVGKVLFPRYYAWGATAGAVALASLVSGALCVPELRGGRIGVQAALLLLSTLIMLYAGNVLAPAVAAAGEQGDAARERFTQLHRRSVFWNMVVLMLGLVLLGAFVTRPRVQTAGIVEYTPAERAQREEDAYLRALQKRKGAETPSPRVPTEAR